MREAIPILLAFVRLVMHSFAAAAGFSLLAAITLIPLQAMRVFVLEGDPTFVEILKLLEVAIFYLDVVAFCLTVVAATYLFLKSLWEAVTGAARGVRHDTD